MKEDLTLIKDVLRNRSRAVEALYDRFAPPMLSLCFRYTGNLHDAEDVLHEGFIKIIKNLSGFKPKSEHSVEAWMKRIMTNTALNFLRDNAKSRRFVDIENVAENINFNEEEYLESDLAHLPVTQEQIMKLIGELPVGYRTVFNLYVFEDYSHREICEKLNFSESTSKSQLFKARAVLRAKIIETINVVKTR